ncbi:hypothetical protein D3C85_1134720 [compost metagenome]
MVFAFWPELADQKTVLLHGVRYRCLRIIVGGGNLRTQHRPAQRAGHLADEIFIGNDQATGRVTEMVFLQ